MVRGDLKFTKVVVSDDLAAPAVRVLPPGARAVTFLAAGGDLIIVGDPTLAPTMVRAIKAKAAADARFRASILPKTTRILQMKARRGLTSCS